ncbi:hypothetical protein GOBAR_DD28081 [Gossypium barbadense]|nr:hypothetical protein GOBAR_DD28081 [Gossypium barbadense]
MSLMGLVATSAYVKGSSVLGIIPRAFKGNALCGPTIGKELPVWSIPERLVIMFDTDDALIALPRGFGTLEEVFCITSWSSFFKMLMVIITILDLCFQRQGMSSLHVKLQAFEYHPDLITQQIFESRKRKSDSDKQEMHLTLSL